MSTKALGFVCLFTFLLSARADRIVVQETEMSGGMIMSSTNRVTTKFKGTKIRINTGTATSSISDSESGENIHLWHTQKQYQRIKESDSQSKERSEWAKKAMAQRGSVPEKFQEPRPTGTKQKINGYDTEQYLWEGSMGKFSFWITKDIPTNSITATTSKGIDKSVPGRTFNAGYFPESLPGYPIRTESEFPIPTPTGLTPQQLKQSGFVPGRSTKVVTTVISIKEEHVDDSEFEIPKDYVELGIAPPTNPAPATGGGSFEDILKNMRKEGLSEKDAKELEQFLKKTENKGVPPKSNAKPARK